MNILKGPEKLKANTKTTLNQRYTSNPKYPNNIIQYLIAQKKKIDQSSLQKLCLDNLLWAHSKSPQKKVRQKLLEVVKDKKPLYQVHQKLNQKKER